MDKLDPKNKKALMGMAHSLKPVVTIGRQGLTETVAQETDSALLAHELIKVKFTDAAADQRKTTSKMLAEQVEAQIITTIGHITILYRPHPENPQITLPG